MAFKRTKPKSDQSAKKSAPVKSASATKAKKGSSGSKMRVFGVIAAIIFGVTAAAYMNNREESNKVSYMGLSSQLLMLSQRLAKDAQQALSGDSAAFDALTESKTSLSNILAKLDKGDGALPPTPDPRRDATSFECVHEERKQNAAGCTDAGRRARRFGDAG